MSILGGVEKIHNNLNTYTTEDIKVFKFSANEWEAILNDDDYSLLEPIRDWRALGKTPIIEIPGGVLGVSSGRVAGFIYLPLITAQQSSEYTILGFQTMGENVVCAASIVCRGTNIISFSVHTSNLPIISRNTVDGELLTTDGDKLITSGISISDLEDLHDDVNTKTFYLSGTSDLTNAQAAYDWYKAGKNPIIRISGWNYSFILEGNNSEPTYHLGFYGVNGGANDGISNSFIGINPRLELRYSSDTVTSVVVSGDSANVLFTNVNYSTPYTPTYNGSPATKKYVDDSVSSAISAGTTAPSNPTEGQIWYDTTNDVVKVYDGTNWAEVGKEYNAGEGIEIGTYDDYSAMRGPCPKGFHIPTSTEARNLLVTTTFGITAAELCGYLKSGRIYKRGINREQSGTGGFHVWTLTASGANADGCLIYMNGATGIYGVNKATACYIRPFKDTPVVPDSSWTILYDGSSVASGAGIFWNPASGLISISKDGTTWTTIADKNLGATTVYNTGDVITTANTGYVYQRGNNYGFEYSITPTTSSTQVDASNYGPGNYYSSSTFITGSTDWSSVTNNNLWGGTTGVVTLDNAINNKGVLSVNGQTGDVSIAIGAGDGINVTNNEVSAKIGKGLKIGTYQDYSAMRGPCPEGFHVPMMTEWQSVRGILTTTLGLSSNSSTTKTYLKLPQAGYRSRSSGNAMGSSSNGYYWTCEQVSDSNAWQFFANSSQTDFSGTQKSGGYSIRGFKDIPVKPDGNWEVLYDGSSVALGAGVFRSLTLGLISISGDGETWYTIADKNVGATVVYNDGDTLSENNCGWFFQRGNNYGFPRSGSITTSSTQVDTTGYGPGNYYSDSTFITGTNWSSTSNNNLWGGGTGVVTLDNAIINTGVLSINGKTGDIAVEQYSAGPGIEIGMYDDYSAMQGPCPSGFHLPKYAEANDLKTTLVTTFGLESTGGTLETYLKIPAAGSMYSSGGVSRGSFLYWTCSCGVGTNVAYRLYVSGTNGITVDSMNKNYLYAIRPFKDKPVIPNNSWTTLYDGSSVAPGAGIFYNSTLGLISISGDGIKWTTISDKNLGATVVYNSGNELNDSNCGGYFGRGNNCMFMPGTALATSSEIIDASNYGPGNYYYANEYKTNAGWDSSKNTNLWGAATGVVTLSDAIVNTGVFSINGKTGDVIMSEPTVISGDSGTTYTIKVSNSAPASGTPNSTITFVI